MTQASYCTSCTFGRYAPDISAEDADIGIAGGGPAA
eukprot:SAG31_NODE_16761_length_697_cov_1.096990_1_plen_35_part_10